MPGGSVGNVTVDRVVAAMKGTRPGDSKQRATAIYFLTGHTSADAAKLAGMTADRMETWLGLVFRGSPFGVAFGVTGVNDRIVERVIAQLPDTRPSDPKRKATAAFFLTANTAAAAAVAGMTHGTLKTILSQVFAGSLFGQAFDEVRR